MFINKKLLFLIAFSALYGEIVQDYDSGKVKLTQILSNDETGVLASEAHIKKADVQNIAEDLNTAEIARFFGCKTTIGNTFLSETLKSPISPEDSLGVIENRQKIIRALVENPDFKQEVEKLLEVAQAEEQMIIELLSEFFIGKSCPELRDLETIKQQYPVLYPFNRFMLMNPTGRTLLLGMNLFTVGTCLSGAGLAGYEFLNSSSFEAALGSAYCVFIAGLIGYQLGNDYKSADSKRVRLHSFNQLITVAEKIEQVCKAYTITTQFKISDIKSPEGAELIEKLKHSRYKDKKSLLFMFPFVHTFLYRVYEQEKNLAAILASIAEMDAYNAIATKIIESQDAQNKFCFVTFIENDTPTIHAELFWNVLVKNPIASSLTENKHIILTGPNAGGKTTSIRALLQNIILGQTFGVAAATDFEMTKFDVICSYMNISDDILKGLSLFASEIKRAQEIVQKIKMLGNGKKFFFALDELFTGTVAEDGEICAYEFVKKIASSKGVQCIYSTHFNKLKELGNADEHCVNYKVDAPIKNGDNKLVYPYTLSKGANESRVALDLAREAFLFE